MPLTFFLQFDTAGLQQQAAEELLACRPESPVAHYALALSRWYGYRDPISATRWYESALAHSEKEEDEIIGAMSAWCAVY